MDGPLALSPVDVELEIEVGKRSKLLNMVVGDVLGKVRQAKLAIKEEIVQVKNLVFDTIFSHGSLKILILISILNFEIFFCYFVRLFLLFSALLDLGTMVLLLWTCRKI